MKALLLLPLLAFALTGCGGSSLMQASTKDGTLRQFTDGELAAYAQCPLRVCVQNVGWNWPSHTALLGREYFASAINVPTLSPRNCDVGLTYNGISADQGEVVSAYDGSPLFHVDANFRRMAMIMCALTRPGEPAGDKLAAQRAAAGQAEPVYGAVPAAPKVVSMMNRNAAPRGFVAARGPAPAPAAAPDQSLSAADVERIAKAVRGSDAPAPPAGRALPPSPSPSFSSPERPDDLAVIVGIESYSDIASKAPYSERDAEAVKAHVRALGVPERNIVLLTGSKAVRSALTKNIEGWLPRLAKPDSRVYFYFSGHGAPDVKTGQAYLVPWDGDPNFLDATAYPVAQLYKKLGELPAKQVLVAMDSCFSGAGGRSVLASGARPLVGKIDSGAVPAKITVLAASANNEISGSLDDKGHGAFTYFLLQGLDAGKTTPKQLSEYLTPRVQDEARRLNRDQTPQLQGDGSWSLR